MQVTQISILCWNVQHKPRGAVAPKALPEDYAVPYSDAVFVVNTGVPAPAMIACSQACRCRV